MRKEWDISKGEFDTFLRWLDSDRDRAGAKYEDIRHRLIVTFRCRGCPCSEDLADETINRVVRRIQELVDSYTGNPALYFYGVARNVYQEYVKQSKPRHHPLPPPPPEPEPTETNGFKCLERCMDTIARANRELLLAYYSEDGHAKITRRKKLADELGIALNALRIRAYRIRKSLQSCVEDCIQQSD